MVRSDRELAAPVKGKIVPEKMSWTIKTKGMTVIAAVVFFTREEMASPSTSEE